MYSFQITESTFEIQLLKKIGYYKLMELLYCRLPKEEVYSKESRINQAYCGSDKTEGKELSKTLIKYDSWLLEILEATRQLGKMINGSCIL